ncbi:MAG: hypothetical protein JWP66_625 [Naasia sp.]|nr:hypothetical protein [Naasia sp.]
MTLMDDTTLRSELRRAVIGGQITAAYQPQIDLASGRIVAAEVLSRWYHPRLGAISPGTFIPMAEEDDLIIELGDSMLGEGSSCAIDWFERGTPIEVSVNVSAFQLAAARFFERLVERSDYLQLPHGLLTVEITESQVISDMPFVVRRLERLRELGFNIAIDDFGAGHSSVSRVVELPVTEVKLDLSLTQNSSPASSALIAAVVKIAAARDLRVVAEGVETRRQLDRVRSIGCDRAQGYLIAKPLSRDDFEARLDDAPFAL